MNEAASSEGAPPIVWALRHRASHLRLWIAAAIGLVADLWTKYWAFEHVDAHTPREILPGVLSFTLSLNPGALFGLGAGFPAIFVGASVLALMFVLYLFANSDARRWSLHIALGLVLAGAMGNLYDRTMHDAYVHDPGNPRDRDIGVLLSQDEKWVTLGDWPSGANPRRHLRVDNPATGRQPVVRDFLKIELRLGRFQLWPWIFNIADALLVVGVAILLVNFWREHRELKRAHGT